MNTRVGSPGLEEKKATPSHERRGVGLIRAALAISCCVHCLLSMRVRILREGIGSRLERVVHGLVRRGVFEILHLQSRRDTNRAHEPPPSTHTKRMGQRTRVGMQKDKIAHPLRCMLHASAAV